MARITQSFTYALPTELYVSGISTTKTGTYTYIGPDQFDVEIDGQGKIVMIDAKAFPSPERKKTINANEAAQLPVAYLARGHVDEDDFEWGENYTDEVLDNGDVYKVLSNPDLEDAYEIPRWDEAAGKWVIDQTLKPQQNRGLAEAERRKSYVETYYAQYDFGTDIDTKIDAYLVGITSYINANPPYKTWKYTTLPTPPAIPKIPASVMAEFAKVPMPHQFTLGGGPTLNFPDSKA